MPTSSICAMRFAQRFSHYALLQPLKTLNLMDLNIYGAKLCCCQLIWTVVAKNFEEETATEKIFTIYEGLKYHHPKDVAREYYIGLLKYIRGTVKHYRDIQVKEYTRREYAYGTNRRLDYL